jgi:putative ABC transport system permease protein
MARAYRVPLGVMRVVAFSIGSVVIALTAYTAIADRRREYGIMKAMGARARHLNVLALEQSLLLAAGGLVAGGILFVAGQALIGELRPQFVIVTTTASLLRAVVAAVAMGAIASLVPARRLARLQPAVAYRGS